MKGSDEVELEGPIIVEGDNARPVGGKCLRRICFTNEPVKQISVPVTSPGIRTREAIRDLGRQENGRDGNAAQSPELRAPSEELVYGVQLRPLQGLNKGRHSVLRRGATSIGQSRGDRRESLVNFRQELAADGESIITPYGGSCCAAY